MTVKNTILLSILILFACGTPAVNAAPYYDITDRFMAEYEGFWTAKNGAKGRLTAQVHPLSNNRYDGFILFVRVKTPVTAFKLNPAVEETGARRLHCPEFQCGPPRPNESHL